MVYLLVHVEAIGLRGTTGKASGCRGGTVKFQGGLGSETSGDLESNRSVFVVGTGSHGDMADGSRARSNEHAVRATRGLRAVLRPKVTVRRRQEVVADEHIDITILNTGKVDLSISEGTVSKLIDTEEGKLVRAQGNRNFLSLPFSTSIGDGERFDFLRSVCLIYRQSIRHGLAVVVVVGFLNPSLQEPMARRAQLAVISL
jgi:hypothetical protein